MIDKRSKILVVDDDSVNIRVITAALKDDYDILFALNAQDAIRQVREVKPDLILLDVMMPEVSGFDLCIMIKADDSVADIPIIFLTALDSIDGELQGLKLGGVDYITKPVNFPLLKQRIRNHLDLKEQKDQVVAQRNLLARKNEELEAAMARVKHLEGIIPICMYCKKIRDDRNSWHQLEQYISEHSEALFSHGICPHCEAEQREIIKNMKRPLV